MKISVTSIVMMGLMPLSVMAKPPLPSEASAVKNVITWALTLNAFKGATSINKDSAIGSTAVAQIEIRSTDGRLVLNILDDGALFANLQARRPWDDRDTILLRAIAKHLTGDPGKPITPGMAISAIQDDMPAQYLTNGKLEFAYYPASVDMCPWKGDCYSISIWVTPP